MVDERSIEDVRPDDVRGFTQCHFFAGIGVWSYALRRAGWPDDRPVWTGSCPCQPFSAAGKGSGFADERHLWPAFHHLIRECRPAIVLGEQVASKDADAWIDLVQTDLEGMDYAFGCVPFPSAGVGAPHIRDRAYWVADANLCGQPGATRLSKGRYAEARVARNSSDGGMADAVRPGSFSSAHAGIHCTEEGTGAWDGKSERCVAIGRMADADGRYASAEREQRGREQRQQPQNGGLVQTGLPGPTNGFWRAADWLGCRDGKWRPVEPSTFPLAHGASARVGRLRAYGNAINAEAAKVFIESVMESI
ncbi:DNA cytosine methyltransferase [Robbsia andropogonis]|uniref:DNA cytosine methyltransferase n=1 Tax=Robbsia andropogonis TaxID=28092 RepID=UPI003D1B65D5